eukprot:g5881.t1
MMLRRRRIAKAKAIVGQLLGEAHGFVDAEVEEFTLQYMNLSEQLVFKPGDDQQAKIATQTLLHMACNVMSDQQVTNLLRASQHPWLTGAKLVKQRTELTQEVIPKYGLEGAKDASSTLLLRREFFHRSCASVRRTSWNRSNMREKCLKPLNPGRRTVGHHRGSAVSEETKTAPVCLP